MIFLIEILIILLLVFLICCIKVGIRADYISGEFSLAARFSRFSYRILPKLPAKTEDKKEAAKEAAAPKEKKSKKKKKKEQELHLLIGNDEMITALKKIGSAIGRLNRGIKVDRFQLHYIAAGVDPYDTTRIFGFVNSLLCTMAPMCAKRFPCKDVSVYTEIDYNREEMLCDGGIDVTVRIGTIFAAINTVLFGLLGILLKNRQYRHRLQRTDPEEYAFLLAHPSVATKLITGLLKKKTTKSKEQGNAEQKDSEQGSAEQNSTEENRIE